MLLRKNIILALMITILMSHFGHAQDQIEKPKILEDAQGEALAFYVENDSRYIGGPGTDQGYSNGLKFSYVYAQNQIPYWSKKLVDQSEYLDKKIKASKVNYGISLGHQIFTPTDTKSTELIQNDRPYVGYLYLGFAMNLKRPNSEQFFVVELGTVGPSALGEPVQNAFHRTIDVPETNGWQNSLHDEPVVQLHYQQRIKTLKLEYMDVIPFYGLGLGNVFVGGHAGSLVRVGYNLPKTYGSTRPSASNGNSFISPSIRDNTYKTSVYVFGGLRGNLVARNLFLDGNTLRPSHSVTKYPVNYETELSLGVQFDQFGFLWSFVVQSPEFEERSRYNSFASLSLVYLL